jgi:uncharacterized protein YjbJ (UPF0337 family)
MTEKLELLEGRVRETLEETKSTVEGIVENVKGTVDETVGAVKETVDGAKSTVEGIVENVKETMDETVSNVKQAFDLSYQVNQRPWLMFGGAVLLGGLLGRLMSDESRTNGYEYESDDDEDGSLYASALADGPDAYGEAEGGKYSESQNRRGSAQTSRRQGWMPGLGQFQEEFNIIKSAIIGTMMGALREMIRQNMPNVAPTLEKAVNSASRKLGAEPIDPSTGQQQTESETWRESVPQTMTGSQPAASSSPREAPGQRQYGAR